MPDRSRFLVRLFFLLFRGRLVGRLFIAAWGRFLVSFLIAVGRLLFAGLLIRSAHRRGAHTRRAWHGAGRTGRKVAGLAGGVAESPQPTWNAAKPANAINTNKFFIEMLLKVKRVNKIH